mgnify:CR=1 FL=1
MKKVIVLLVLSASFNGFSQVREIAEKGSGIINLEPHQVTFNLVNPGISYEIGLFRNVSASGASGFGITIILIGDWIWVKTYPEILEII